MMYMPIWFLYIFPIFLPVNFISKLILIAIAYWISVKSMHLQEVRKAKGIWLSWAFGMFAEFIGIFIFYITDMNIDMATYNEHYMLLATSIFVFELIVNFLFNYLLMLRKQIERKSKRILTAAIITVLSAPYLFLLPQ